ncbi:MAG TPA: GNAT family N-acetyltransferase [Pyrinomonadaceae bacterium]|nr:GNAT family N-acetyltransferase [Pyrinomonadaceae bacterium]
MAATNTDSYPFVDIDLARRLEQTEAMGNVKFIEARIKAFPDRGATWRRIGGTFAMFDAVGSPLTQTFGLGMFQPVTNDDMDQLERFFHDRGSDVFHEVSPLADPSAMDLLNERRYRPIELTSVMFRPITTDLRLDATRNDLIAVRLINDDEEDLWAQTAADGWNEYPELRDFLLELGKVNAQSESLSFIAELKGKAIAAGALTINDDVALLAGASTIPEFRRNGAQLALLEDRLRYGAGHGCNTAMIAARPGSASQRNAERHGFRIAYTRIKWELRSAA